jgi:hypothetical protein
MVVNRGEYVALSHRLLLEILHLEKEFTNHTFRKEGLRKGVISFTYYYSLLGWAWT